MKAYILSRIHGTVQIGRTVFQPCSGAQFKASRRGLRSFETVDVKRASMEEARKALRNEKKGVKYGRSDS